MLRNSSISISLKLAAVALLAALAFSATLARADIVLVGEGVAPSPICFMAKGNPLEAAAAKQLAKYFEKLSGAKFPVIPLDASAPHPDRAVLIGALAAESGKDLQPDAFRIVTRGQTLQIVGGNARGALYGVFALLEKHFDCRWWSYDEED